FAAPASCPVRSRPPRPGGRRLRAGAVAGLVDAAARGPDLAVADHPRRVGVDHEAGVARLLERAQGAGQVDPPLSDEALVEAVALPLQVAQVDEGDLAPRAEVADPPQDRLVPTHLG